MPVPGGTTRRSPERRLRPAQQLVALAVALVLAGDVEGERRRRPELVDLDRVVDDEVSRDERIDLGRVAAEVGHRVAHRARSTIAGTPVKSWSSTRDGMNGTSASVVEPGRHDARVSRPRLDNAAAGMPQRVLEQDLDRDGAGSRSIRSPSAASRQ